AGTRALVPNVWTRKGPTEAGPKFASSRKMIFRSGTIPSAGIGSRKKSPAEAGQGLILEENQDEDPVSNHANRGCFGASTAKRLIREAKWLICTVHAGAECRSAVPYSAVVNSASPPTMAIPVGTILLPSFLLLLPCLPPTRVCGGRPPPEQTFIGVSGGTRAAAVRRGWWPGYSFSSICTTSPTRRCA